jgi:hypothetical protein
MRKLFVLVCFCIIFPFVTLTANGQSQGQGGRAGGHDFFGEAMSDMDRAVNTTDPSLEYA